jgi:O-antigen ligase
LQQFKALFKARNLYLFSLILIATGLSVSKPLIVLGQICLLVLWIFTSDLRRKLHLFLLPFFLASFSPLTRKEVLLLFRVYVFWVVFSSLWSIFVMFGGIEEQILDKRQLSRFNSHIRFGLEICMAVFGSVFYFFKNPKSNLSILWLIVAAWLIIFLFLAGMFTGIVVLFATAIILLTISSIRSKKMLFKVGSIAVLLVLIVATTTKINKSIDKFYGSEQVEELPILSHSPNGEEYAHDTTGVRKNDKENGYYIWRNIAWGEVKAEWEKRSELDFYGYDLKGQILTTTLIRFLTSKGETKDRNTLESLTNEEIAAIEKGVSNVEFLTMSSVDKRLNKIIWEYDNYSMGRDYNGHSVIMRLEYLKTAFRIIKKNPMIGVGTGDVKLAFDNQYEQDNSLLIDKYRLRAHNQYATYAVSFGLVGLILFLVFLIYPIIKLKLYGNYFYLAFLAIALMSMLTEDTLETQVGIVFFAFFNSLLLLNEEVSKS